LAARIYLDHAASTPVLPQARAAMQRGFDAWANPSSPHAEGRGARALLEEARATLATELGWRHDVIFTSGASEAIEMVAARVRLSGRAHGATEHAIVPHAMGPKSVEIAVGSDGLIDEGALAEMLAQGPGLVAIQAVNNETGILQPIDRIAERVRGAG
jgi:cysteine desulfurase